MKKLSLFILMFSALALVSCSDSNPVLTIEGGQVIGVPTPTKGIIAYKGLPFAAPPVGKLRWVEPQPVVPWTGVKKAATYGAAARTASISMSGLPPRDKPVRNSRLQCGYTAEAIAKVLALNQKWMVAKIGHHVV